MFCPVLRNTSLALALLLPLGAHAAGTRTHVSNSGSDANTAFSCDDAHQASSPASVSVRVATERGSRSPRPEWTWSCAVSRSLARAEASESA